MSDSKGTEERNIFRASKPLKSKQDYVCGCNTSKAAAVRERDENIKCDVFGWELLVLRNRSF